MGAGVARASLEVDGRTGPPAAVERREGDQARVHMGHVLAPTHDVEVADATANLRDPRGR